MSRYIVASRDVESGEVILHQSGGYAGYHTVCGISLDDAQYETADVPSNARITCKHCWSIYQDMLRVTASDFAREAKS